MSIQPIYRCPACKSEYRSQEAAESCKSVPLWPAETKLAVLGNPATPYGQLFTVRVDPRGKAQCCQWIGLHLHSTWGRKSMGMALPSEKKAGDGREDGFCRYRPLTVEIAGPAAEALRKEAKSLRRQAERAEAKAKVLEAFIMGSERALADVEP